MIFLISTGMFWGFVLSCFVSFPKEREDLFSGLKAPGNKMCDLYQTLKKLFFGSFYLLRLTGENWHFVSRCILLLSRCLTLNCFSSQTPKLCFLIQTFLL